MLLLLLLLLLVTAVIVTTAAVLLLLMLALMQLLLLVLMLLLFVLVDFFRVGVGGLLLLFCLGGCWLFVGVVVWLRVGFVLLVGYCFGGSVFLFSLLSLLLAFVAHCFPLRL